MVHERLPGQRDRRRPGHRREGGDWTIDLTQTSGALPTRTILAGQFASFENLNGNAVRDTRMRAVMLTDVGMVKGLIQTSTALGPWKQYLAQNPFDIRRPYVAAGVAGKLANTMLLGRPARARQFQYAGAGPDAPVGPAHATYLGGRGA
jgi:hypothetical protein